MQQHDMRRFTAVLGLLLLAACAAPGPAVPPSIVPAPPPQQLTWTTAIGALHNIANGQVCTATLVQQDLVLTAAHCLSDGAAGVAPKQLTFIPNEGAAPTFAPLPVLAIQATGNQVQQGLIDETTAVGDWALLRIESAPSALHPLAVNALRWAQIEARLASGDRFFSGGYGKPGMLVLTQHANCAPVDAARFGQFLDDGLIASDCLVRPRDSGGPMVLVDVVGRPHLIAVISGIGQPFSAHPFGIGVESKNFMQYFNTLNISERPNAETLQPAS